jgi:hypothetical protein
MDQLKASLPKTWGLDADQIPTAVAGPSTIGRDFDRWGVNSLATALGYWKALDYSGSGKLLDGNGHGYDLELGSSSGADSNDPKWLPYAGTQYIYWPGVSSNALQFNDIAAYNPSGDQEWIVRVQLEDYGTASAVRGLASQSATSTTNASWQWSVNTSNRLSLQAGTTGTALTTYQSSVTLASVGIAANTLCWLRTTRANATGTVKHYYSVTNTNDPASVVWTQLGADITSGAFVGAPFNSTALLTVGALATGAVTSALGSSYRFQFILGGTVQLDLDYTNTTNLATPFTTMLDGSVNAATGTFVRTSANRFASVVTRNGFLLGGDDYFELADNPAFDFGHGDPFTLLIGFRTYAITANRGLMTKRSTASAGVGWELKAAATNKLNFTIGDGTPVSPAQTANNAIPTGTRFSAVGLRSTSSQTLQVFSTTDPPLVVSDPTLGTLANSVAFRIGAFAGGSGFMPMQFYGAAIWNVEVSQADLIAAAAALLV